MKPEGDGVREGERTKGGGVHRREQARKEGKQPVLNFLALRALAPQLSLLLSLLYCFPEAQHWILAYFCLLQLLGRDGSSCFIPGFWSRILCWSKSEEDVFVKFKTNFSGSFPLSERIVSKYILLLLMMKFEYPLVSTRHRMCDSCPHSGMGRMMILTVTWALWILYFTCRWLNELHSFS